MFYNTYRTTKSAQREAEQNKLAGIGSTIINPRERLLNLQKRQRLKDLLITKFMQKYGIKHPEQLLESEITKFLQGEKLTDADLKRLDAKIKKLLQEKAAKENLKSSLTQSLQENTLQKTQSNENVLNKNITITDETLNQNFQKTRGNSTQPRIVTTAPNDTGNYTLPNITNTKTTFCKKFKKPEEELAELEAEFAEEEAKNKKNHPRLDFSNEGDEWAAMAKYNRKIYEKQIQDEKIRDKEMQKRNREDLDLQIKQRLKKEYEDELKEKEYDKLMKEHQKKLDELERQKKEAIKRQIMREKETRDAQAKEENIRKRIEILKDKKFEKSLVKTYQETLENERRQMQEKKMRENQALKNAIKENEIQKQKRKEQEKKEKEEDVKMAEERIKMEMKEDLTRQKYYETIKKYGNKYNPVEAEQILAKMKKDQEEEDKKTQFYYDEKNRLEIEKERNREIQRYKEKEELKKYLDMQIEERKKEEEFLKSLDDEQARIWAIDSKKYMDDEKAIEKKIKAMNKRNLDLVMEQMRQRKLKRANKNRMSDTEYAMNRDTLLKAKETLKSQ